MNEMMKGWTVEGKNGMGQSEPAPVIPSHNGSSWTRVSESRLYSCQSTRLGFTLQAEELEDVQTDAKVDWMWS